MTSSPPNLGLDLPAPKAAAISDPQPARRLLKRTALIAALALAGLAAVRSGRSYWTTGRFLETTDDAYVGGDITVMSTQVPGFVTRVAVADNQTVRAGDLLIQLDDRDYRAALAKADASIALQQAVLANLDATHHVQDAVIVQARAAINATAAEISRAQADELRTKQLLETGAISVQVYQQADTDSIRAQAEGDKARAALDIAQRQLNVIATQKLQAEASLQQAEAARETARLNLEYTQLRAPLDGIVGNRSAQVGAYAGAGAQLISIVPLHGLWIDANFKESQIGVMHPGLSATVQIDSIPNQTFRGKVASIAPATGAKFSVLPPENATGNFTRIVQRLAVRIVLDDPAPLRPGLSVKAEVDTRSDANARP